MQISTEGEAPRRCHDEHWERLFGFVGAVHGVKIHRGRVSRHGEFNMAAVKGGAGRRLSQGFSVLSTRC